MNQMLDGNTAALNRHLNEEEMNQELRELKDAQIQELAEEFFTSMIYRSDDRIIEAMGPDNLKEADYKKLGQHALYARGAHLSDEDRIANEAAFGKYLLTRMADYAMPYCIKMAERKVME